MEGEEGVLGADRAVSLLNNLINLLHNPVNTGSFMRIIIQFLQSKYISVWYIYQISRNTHVFSTSTIRETTVLRRVEAFCQDGHTGSDIIVVRCSEIRQTFDLYGDTPFLVSEDLTPAESDSIIGCLVG